MTGVEWAVLGAGMVVVEVVFALAVGRWLQSCREAWAELDASVAAAIAAHPTSPGPVADDVPADPVPVLERTDTAQAPERECPKADTYFDGARWRCKACAWTSPREEADRGRARAGFARQVAAAPGNDWGRGERVRAAAAQERLLAEMRAEHDLLRARDDWAAKTIDRVIPDPSSPKGER